MDIVERIDELCRNRNMNKYDLEKKLGFGHGSIQKWSVHTPKVTNIAKVAGYFGVRIEYLLDGQYPLSPADYQISAFEYEVIQAFRVYDHQDAILDMLGIKRPSEERRKKESCSAS